MTDYTVFVQITETEILNLGGGGGQTGQTS